MVTQSSITLFLWPPAALAAVVAAFCTACAALAWFFFHVRPGFGVEYAPQPPFHAGIVALFGLLLSFTANDAWRRSEAAYGALLRESQEASAMLPLLSALEMVDRPRAAEARIGLRDYLSASLNEEWRSHNVMVSVHAAQNLDRIRQASAQGLVSGGVAGPAWRTVQDRLDGIQQARTARLVAGGLYGDALRWTCLLTVYLAGAFAIAAVHLDRHKALRVALPIYAVVGTVALSLIALSEQPYTGWDAVEPDRLIEVLSHMPG